MTVHFPLLSARLQVRPFRTDDVPAVHAVYGDPEVMRHVARGNAASAEESAKMVHDHIEHQRANGYACWAVVERSTGHLIGDAGFEARAEGAEFGYTLARRTWGRGLATEAGKLCIDAAFRQLQLPRLSAIVDPSNPASARVLGKLGFQFTGTRLEYGRTHHEYLLTDDAYFSPSASGPPGVR
ncbi:GNAT family N-acetyltransferase [Saccharopolyspora indica]|uniref:GNAT family N-acetyltransferase n=1 Tax=Saccharopolyspora indica TaxID=1229659 RepID=UPI0022EA6F6F|nr:GNAT family N-acetyltransferase [Saccharopolyspora indica]MDA3647514.1 GNAT family N-acetyltransferase [Saccharopolyspora indica]